MTGDFWGKYAGQPLRFFCAKCRRSDAFAFYRHRGREPRRGRRWRLTGRTRKQRSQGMDHHNWGDAAFQYECLDCGHVGWSRHPDVRRHAVNAGLILGA